VRRTLLTAILVVAAYFAGRAAYVALAGDETKIRWLFAGEAAAFNGCAGLSVLASFAPDYHDTTADVSRQMLHGGLLWLFQNRRDPQSRRFLYRVELQDDHPVDVAGDRATATLPVRLYEGLDEQERLVWELRVHAELQKRDGAWWVERSRHETVQGAMPRR
jgi:hypothetical protein